MDCFAEPVIGRRFAPARWLAMTAGGSMRQNLRQKLLRTIAPGAAAEIRLPPLFHDLALVPEEAPIRALAGKAPLVRHAPHGRALTGAGDPYVAHFTEH